MHDPESIVQYDNSYSTPDIISINRDRELINESAVKERFILKHSEMLFKCFILPQDTV